MTTILLQPLVLHIVIEIRPLKFWGLRINVGDCTCALLNGLKNIGGISEGKKSPLMLNSTRIKCIVILSAVHFIILSAFKMSAVNLFADFRSVQFKLMICAVAR